MKPDKLPRKKKQIPSASPETPITHPKFAPS